MMIIPFCIECGKKFGDGEALFYAPKCSWLPTVKQYICYKCSERKTMPNIKITAEVDGKQVPLETVSTETFEAIKALEKSKEIPVPVARLANYNLNNGLRLLFKPTEEIILEVGKVYSLDLKSGRCKANWIAKEKEDEEIIRATYRNVKPL